MKSRPHVFFLSLILLLWPSWVLCGTIDAKLAALLAQTSPDTRIGVLVRLAGDTAEYRAARDADDAPSRRRLVEGLKSSLELRGKRVTELIAAKGGIVRRTLWGSSIIAAELDPSAILAVAKLGEVSRVSLDRKLRRSAPPTASALPQPGWHFEAVNAGALWAEGHKGGGTSVAMLDSGVDLNNSAFSGSNWAGLSAGWFDPYGETVFPGDDVLAHGTKVLSLIVGSNDLFNLGLAPESRWLVGRIYDNTGEGDLSAIHAVFQWLLDPDDNPATDDAPDAVCNSWGFESDEGLCDREFQTDIDNLTAAGMLVVFAAGNAGPATGTDVSPANNRNVLSVGASNINDSAASFSARGPNSCNDGTYPDLTAPGVSVTAADYTFGGAFPDALESVNGTSFSTPVTVGAALLLKSAWPGVSMEEIGNALRQSAKDIGEPGPDDSTGRGLVDIEAAHRLLAGCIDADGDGYFTGGEECGAADCDDAKASVHPGACDEPKDGIDQDCSGADATSGPTCKKSSSSSGGGPFLGGCFIEEVK